MPQEKVYYWNISCVPLALHNINCMSFPNNVPQEFNGNFIWKIIFFIQLNPYCKLNAVGKVWIHGIRCSPKNLWNPLYVNPFPHVQDWTASPLTGQKWQLSSGPSQSKESSPLAKEKGEEHGLTASSLHFMKTAVLLGHKRNSEAVRSQGRIPKLQISCHTPYLILALSLLTQWKKKK